MKVLRAMVIASSMALFSMLLHHSSVGWYVDNIWGDFLVKKDAASHSVDPNILLIDIDDESLESMQSVSGKWPWPRSIHAFLIEGLLASNVRVIVFDILFSEHDIYRPDSDKFFAEVAASTKKLYLASSEISPRVEIAPTMLLDWAQFTGMEKTDGASMMTMAKLMLPKVVAAENWQTGSINFDVDSDGVGRFYDVRRNLSGWLWKSLAAKVALDLQNKLPEDNRVRLHWYGSELIPFPSISYSDLFFNLEKGETSQLDDLLNNKIIIVGSSATGLFDSRVTPINSHYPAISILTTAINNFMDESYYHDVSPSFVYTQTFVLVFLLSLSAILSRKFRSLYRYCWPVWILISVILLYSSSQSLKFGYFYPVFFTLVIAMFFLLLITLSKGVIEYIKRQQLIGLFSRFIDPRVVNELIENRQLELSTQSRHCQVTVLFSDIRGFTTISEQHTAQQIVALLNNYFSKQVETIFKYGGTLDKFIGDAIMAFWGAPVNDPAQADNAIRAALEMSENLIAFRNDLPESLQHFDIGIGLHSGEAVVGMIGSDRRYDYTVIGDTVNVASRIEGLTKNRAQILVSEDCVNQTQSEFQWEEAGVFHVKGRDKPVKLYCLRGG